MHLLVDALSCTNLSGRQVLCGHVAAILRAAPSCRLTLLLHASNRDVCEDLQREWGGRLPDSVTMRLAPRATAHWMGRIVYEWLALPRLASRLGVETVLTLSGGWLPGLPCRQVTLALNPWALMPGLARGLTGRFKAGLQRHAYRQAVRHADAIGFSSMHLRGLYRANAGQVERAGAIVYPALGRAEREVAGAILSEGPVRKRFGIVCVSRMARHKDIETLIEALHRLHVEYRRPARLRLVGGWAQADYRRDIEQRIASLGLSDHVELTGHLPRAELYRACATARVYALLSRAESFGIPAIEAQCLGTPVVAALETAAPEVCGEGGLYAPAGDSGAAAALLDRLLGDGTEWQRRSNAAAANARRFTYDQTVRPLMALLQSA